MHPEELAAPPAVRGETFPQAQTPGATKLAQVLEAWKARGLTPVQVTEDEVWQTITVRHNALTGELKWDVDKADGVQAVSLLFSALVDMGEYFFTAKARPRIVSKDTRVALMLEAGQIQMIADPPDDPVITRGLLVAALLRLIERTETPGATLATIMQFEV